MKSDSEYVWHLLDSLIRKKGYQPYYGIEKMLAQPFFILSQSLELVKMTWTEFWLKGWNQNRVFAFAISFCFEIIGSIPCIYETAFVIHDILEIGCTEVLFFGTIEFICSFFFLAMVGFKLYLNEFANILKFRLKSKKWGHMNDGFSRKTIMSHYLCAKVLTHFDGKSDHITLVELPRKSW